MYLNQFRKTWDSKVELVRQAISPTLWFLGRLKIVLQDGTNFGIVSDRQQIEITSSVRPMVEGLHRHDFSSTLLESIYDPMQIRQYFFYARSFVGNRLIQQFGNRTPCGAW